MAWPRIFVLSCTATTLSGCMKAPPTAPVIYRFGLYVLDPANRTLTRNQIRVRLQEQPFRLLVLLVERAGQIVSREEICNRLWAQNTFVEFDKSLGVAVLKTRDALADDADNPRFIETIPRRGYRFIAPVTVETVQEAGSTSAIASAPSHSGWPGRKRWWVASIVILVIAGAGFYFGPSTYRHPVHAGQAEIFRTPIHLRRSVAVLRFRNLPGRTEDDWLSSALCEMLNTELGAGGTLRMVSGEDVAQAKSELPLRDEDSLGKSTLQHLRSRFGADVVVVGSYTMLSAHPEQIRLDVRLQDTARGETITEESVSGEETNLFGLVADLGAKLRETLGVVAESEEGALATRAALPANERAARLYAAGRARLWAFDYVHARELLTQSIAADSRFPLSHAALSEAWDHSGYDAKARAEAQLAVELSNHLSHEQRLLVEGQYQRTVQEWPKAVETYHSLFRLFPDNLDYGLLFASAQMHLSPADAVQTLAALRNLPSPLGDDPRIDMSEASVWINRDFAKARAAAKVAIDKATAQGSSAIVSRTYGILCQQQPAMGASEEGIGDCKNALATSIATKDPNGEAMMRTDLAALYYLRGDVEESAQMFQQAVKTFREIGNRDGVATALSNFADARLSEGDLKDAQRLLEEAIPEYRAIDDKEGVVLNLDSLGDIWRERGELDRAETQYQEAEAIARKMEDKNATAYVLSGMGDLALDRGDVSLARKRHEEAFTLRKQAGEQQSTRESRVSLAKLAIEDGHASDAEASARACREQFHVDHQADDELDASLALIDALLAQRKQDSAQKEMQAAQKLQAATQNRFLRLRFELASGRVLLASEHPETSRPYLQRVADEAQRYGFVGLEFADELALAELANRTGHGARAQLRLQALQKSASSRGFGLIARKALRESSILPTRVGTR